MDNLTFLNNKIKSLIDLNPELKKLINIIQKYKKLKEMFCWFIIIGLSLSIIFLFLFTKLGLNLTGISVITYIIYFIIFILIIMGFIGFIGYRRYKYLLKNTYIDQNVTKYLYNNNVIQKIYEEYYYKYINNDRNDNFKVNIVKYLPDMVDIYDNHYGYLTDDCNRLNKYMQNSFNITYKGKKIYFYILTPKRYITFRGKNNRKEETYVSRALIFYDNKKFDKTFNNIKIVQGKDPEKDLFQSESIKFNEKYYINLKNNDIRAARVLSPKLIDYLANIELKNLYSIGINDEIYADWFLVSDFDYKEDICSFNTIDVINMNTFINKLVNKIIDDFDLFLQLFNCVKIV
ncbi:hypothetical protein [Spiroplasma turonicum]|uniref:DUF3137 domain-containing protein n=1 Tax=Spiroplasma turonicum TaxID=216946 RepID=A0A0K1P6S1_9MOLU|nr:hypothetical protein [Spiroplasma turonicum]AKU79919.1 hypothetical protein STURON_00673 [Spiroplasma turonicum]ALX70932.1 hypothetical protein STURO_v1c06730 [Spiroplasma turonicum]